MRRWFITSALLANALISGLVLLLLLNDGGWGNPTRLSATEAQLLIIVAVVAGVLDLLLIPVLGISFWARDRSTRRLEARLALRRKPTKPDEDPTQGDDDGRTEETIR